MAGEWGSALLDELVEDIIDRRGVTPLKLGSDFVPTGHRVISAKAIRERRVDLSADEPRFVDEVTYRKWMKTPLRADDVILTSEAPLGEVAYVRHDVKWCLGQRLFGIRTRKPLLQGRFLFYALQSDGVRHDLLSRATGTTAQGIRQSELRRVRIPLPDVSEQRAIAHVLGTLDDKIELNRPMNETLEAMARAIFQAWFVDFEPIRAKMEGRWHRTESLSGLPAYSYDLFPDRLVDSELGKIPEGWEVGSCGVFNTQRTERLCDREAVVLSAVASGKLARSDDYFTKRVYSTDIKNYLLVEQWDIAYNPSRINIGSIGMLEEPIVGAVSPVYVVARAEAEYRWFLEFYLRRVHTKEWINTLASGSVRQSLSYADFASIPCIIPPKDVAMQFNKAWMQLRAGIRSCSSQDRSLATLRDALLPKLISGEIRVKSGEGFLKERGSC